LGKKSEGRSVQENTMRSQMKSGRSLTKVEFVFFIVSCLLAVAGCRSDKPEGPPITSEAAKESSPPAATVQKQQQEAEQRLRPEIEAQRQQNQKEAEQTLDPDAINAIQQTERAIDAVAANKKDDALAAIERATGKINILLARKPAAALVPVDVQVVVIDAAPLDLKVIDQIVQQATEATKQRDLPAARLLLAAVVSELRVQTTSLPLATYPAALQQAARLLDQSKNPDAGKVLLTALNTLVVVDHVVPLPLIIAQAAIDEANSQRQNKDVALTLLETAKNEAIRSRHLGYLSDDAEYKALDEDISSLQSAIKGRGDTSSLFAHLRERIAAFIKRHKEHEHR
jgi:hypothetical protein